MNRLLALKHTGAANDSLLSNASHDGYESAMDETMASSASMYYSMNESSLDRTLEPSQPVTSHMDITLMLDMPKSHEAHQQKESTRSVLTPIAEPVITYMSPKRNRRNVDIDSSTPVLLSKGTPSPRNRSLIDEETTVRKITPAGRSENAENVVDNGTMAATDVVSQSIISDSAQALNDAGTESVDALVVTSMDNKTTQTNKEPVEVSRAMGSRRSLSNTFRRQSSVRGRGNLVTIGETAQTSASSLETVPPLMRRITRRSVSMAHSSPAGTLSQTLKTIKPRKSIGLRRQSAVKSLSTIAERTQTTVPNTARSSTLADDASSAIITTAAARRRSVRSMALVVAAASATAAVRQASPHRVAIVRTRKSVAPSNGLQATSLAATSTRRSIAVATATAATTRKVLVPSAAAVLAQNPTRRRTTLMSTTPGRRRMSTQAKPRTPLRTQQQPPTAGRHMSTLANKPRTPMRMQNQPPSPRAQMRRRSVMPVPPPSLPAQMRQQAPTSSKAVVAGSSQTASGYFSCTHCSKHFLQQSRLSTHLRTHAASAATITAALTCVHCMRAFDKTIALRNHQLEHCTKIPVGERRKLLQQRDLEDSNAGAATTASIATKRAASALGSSTQVAAAPSGSRLRAMSPSRAHRGVYQTPNKLIKCNVCAKQFGDPLSFALHAETHGVA